jgi:proliferating cell nuclear antigen
MDASHVCLISAVWPSSDFLKYSSHGTIIIGMHLSNLLKLLKCSNKSDCVTLSIEEEASDVLMISFQDGTRSADFEMKLLDREDDQMTIPEMDAAAAITMESVEFQTVCKDLSSIGDTTTITINEKGVTLTSEGDIGRAVIAYPAIELKYTTEITQSFALRYLNSFAKGSLVSQRVSLKLNPDMPLVVEFKNDVSYLSFYLAPKIDDDVEL